MAVSNKLNWYFNRMRCMSVAEIGHRLTRAGRMYLQRMGHLTAQVVPRAKIENTFNFWVKGIGETDSAPYCQAADQILAGKVDLFSFNGFEFGKTPHWTRNAVTGEQAPLSFGMTLDYRDARKVGDIKFIWVPNRHHQFVTLAQAYFLTGERIYLNGIARQLWAWIKQNPYLYGPNWTSSLELAIRLINWSLVWQLIGGLKSPLFLEKEGLELRDRWLEVIYQHCHFIHGHFSRYSSANNHLIGEAAGLFVAAITWPFWGRARKWRLTAKEELAREMLVQNTEDGVNREQSVFYAAFVLDFFLSAALAGKANGTEFPRECWQRFEAMLVFLATLMDANGHLPMIGDSDDGHVLRLSQEEGFCPYRSLMATGSILCSRPEFKVKAGHLDEKTHWLLGVDADKRFDAISVRAVKWPMRRAFPDGGYYLMGKDWEKPGEVRLVADAGSLGYLSLAAHGHADALTVTLSVAGKEFLIDPGTYAYQSNLKWRNYFRGTAAHNTVRIDQQDQSVIGGKFMWLQRAHTEVEVWQTDNVSDRLVAIHDGYSRLADPVFHRREIYFDKVRMCIQIVDTIYGKKPHTVERFWHFSELCEVKRENGVISAVNDGVRIRLSSTGGGEKVRLSRGQKDPPLGWVSRHFDIKEPTATVVFYNEINGDTTLLTDIVIDFF
jgi:hypothetical protein